MRGRLGAKGEKAFKRYRIVLTTLLFTLCADPLCYGWDLVFIRSSNGVTQEEKGVQIGADLYGLNLRVVSSNSTSGCAQIREALASSETVGVVIAADALYQLDEKSVRMEVARDHKTEVPILILGVRAGRDVALVRTWTSGEVTGVNSERGASGLEASFGRSADITGELRDIHIPFSANEVAYFTGEGIGKTAQLESVWSGTKSVPVFVESDFGKHKVFVASKNSVEDLPGDGDVLSVFAQVAPVLIFNKYAAGVKGWHAPAHYANLTIDDPWLREPYGYVDYSALLGEMEKHRFHTTIAFIPWNYARSQKNVTSLFRSHPDLFSIAIHGDNHDHTEFSDYRSKTDSQRIYSLKQALARMEAFKSRTGISYDPVMVFPHNIASEKTLVQLKHLNYWATVNASNTPEGARRAQTREELLRVVTLAYGGFPSIIRYPASIPKAYIAVSLFLDNPLLLYGHSELFAEGPGAFDNIADDINALEPETRWRSLGEIVQHLYLLKLREDSNYDVQTFSNDLCLENPSAKEIRFFVQKPEEVGEAIDTVTVEGERHAYGVQDGWLRMIVDAAPRSTSCIIIRYSNDLNLAPIDLSHRSASVYLLRLGSDFRDIYVGKSRVGRAFIRYYTSHGITPRQVVGVLLLVLTGIAVLGYCGCAHIRSRVKQHKAGQVGA